MSTELVKYVGSTALAKTEQPVGLTVGRELMKVGAGGLVLYGAASLIPFVGVFLMLLLAVVGGFGLALKSAK